MQIDLLGTPDVRIGGTRLAMPLRQREILAVLADLYEVGSEALRQHLYGERAVSPTTMKAMISHFRRALGGGIAARPYRL